MQKVIEYIKQYPQILIYRHINPDEDAVGSAFGLYLFIKTHFPHKHVVLMGRSDQKLYERFHIEASERPKDEASLGIVLDTSNQGRIDGDVTSCEMIVKIDHHPVVDPYGVYRIEDATASSCAQILALMLKDVSDVYALPALAARALYMGIVGDSNRFFYASTNQRTFEAAAFLAEQGIDLSEIYRTMYLGTKRDLDVRAYILNHYRVYHDIAYYILSDETLQTLQIDRSEGSSYVVELANVAEFKIWVAVTENKAEGIYRVSLRSREYPVNQVAEKFSGGGHRLASGCQLGNLDELMGLLENLQALIDQPSESCIGKS